MFGSERLPEREKSCSTLASCGRCEAYCLKTVLVVGRERVTDPFVHALGENKVRNCAECGIAGWDPTVRCRLQDGPAVRT
eukprot:873052-Prymnesium_polylepis.1